MPEDAPLITPQPFVTDQSGPSIPALTYFQRSAPVWGGARKTSTVKNLHLLLISVSLQTGGKKYINHRVYELWKIQISNIYLFMYTAKTRTSNTETLPKW